MKTSDLGSYKQSVIQSAIDGLVDGGMSRNIAEYFRVFLERIYECGYNEAIRQAEENNSRSTYTSK